MLIYIMYALSLIVFCLCGLPLFNKGGAFLIHFYMASKWVAAYEMIWRASYL